MSKPPTIHDVAGALGLHKSTVSLALSGNGNVSAGTRARVLAVAREMGYEPNPLAQRLAKGRCNSLVCLFSGVLDVGLATEKILLVQKRLSAHGLEAPIYVSGDTAADRGETQAAEITQLCRLRPRAIVCAAQMVEPDVFPVLEAYRQEGGAVVCYDLPATLDCDQVIFDREDNAYQAARYLIERGHRRIGIAMSNTAPWVAGTANAPQVYRLRGFERALNEAGIPVRPEWLFANHTYEQGGSELARRFLSLKERPTGLCIVNDYVALAFMVEVMRAGLSIPEDVSIISHDDQPIAAYCPVPLTTVKQPVEQIAAAVADILVARLEGARDAEARKVLLRSALVERASVGAPPA